MCLSNAPYEFFKLFVDFGDYTFLSLYYLQLESIFLNGDEFSYSPLVLNYLFLLFYIF